MAESTVSNIKYIFEPASVAVIGASEDPRKWGYITLKNIIDGGFDGPIYPVNPKAEVILGLRCYPDIRRVPEDVDLAVIVVPAIAVPSVMESCVEKGVKVTVIISAGFSEVGSEGEKLEQEVVRIARKGNVRIVGPNCMGVYSAKKKLVATWVNVPKEKIKPGPIGFISQSGAFAAMVLRWALETGIPVSAMVSAGNQADLELSDYVMYMADDEATKVIVMYVEGVRNGRKFMNTLEYCAKKQKPVVAMKLGFTSSGANAARSHTGSLTGKDEIYDAIFKKHGVIRVHDEEDMFYVAWALTNLPPLKGNRVGVITSSGGWGVQASDSLEIAGFRLPALPEHILKELNNLLPPFWSKGNPIDLVATGGPNEYRLAAKLLLEDPNFDAVMMLGFVGFRNHAEEEAIVREVATYPEKYGKPLIVVNIYGRWVPGVRLLEDLGVPVYRSVEKGVRALKALRQRVEFLNKQKKG
jgi:acetyl coenzyme A synthetase (ADP forming)-like protein